eukprot:gene13115-14463_t
MAIAIRRRDPASEYLNNSRIYPDSLLDLSQHIAGVDDLTPMHYQLIEMVVHLGQEADSGHYICHILGANNDVITVNDSCVSHHW